MTTSTVGERTGAEPYPIETAADYASVAAILVVGDKLGMLVHLDSGQPVRIAELAKAADLREEIVANYLEALTAAGVANPLPGQPDVFQVVPNFVQIRYEAGYVSWLMNANRPFIEHAREFVESPEHARKSYHRDGREVAVSSQWAGALGFYHLALNSILSENPRRIVDLGAGTARLLIAVLQKIPEATALALDLDGPACAEARKNADRAEIGERLTVVERSIQSIATDPSPVADADVIHAGFVFHDLMPDEEEIADQVMRQCHESLNSGGVLAITDAVPYASSERERRFSAAMTYFHRQFMGRKLLTEAEWEGKLTAAGFDSVEVQQHRLPSARLYVARKR